VRHQRPVIGVRGGGDGGVHRSTRNPICCPSAFNSCNMTHFESGFFVPSVALPSDSSGSAAPTVGASSPVFT